MRNIRKDEFGMVERAVADKIRQRKCRNLAVSSHWIMHTTRIGMHYTHFYLELRSQCNNKAAYFKSRKKRLSKFKKRFKLSKNMRTNKNINNCLSYLIFTHHNLYFVGGDPLSRWGELYNGHKYAVDQVPLTLILVIDNTWEEGENASVCVFQPGSRIDNIFCTLPTNLRNLWTTTKHCSNIFQEMQENQVPR